MMKNEKIDRTVYKIRHKKSGLFFQKEKRGHEKGKRSMLSQKGDIYPNPNILIKHLKDKTPILYVSEKLLNHYDLDVKEHIYFKEIILDYTFEDFEVVKYLLVEQTD